MEGVLTSRTGGRAAAVDELLMVRERIGPVAAPVNAVADAADLGALAVKLAPIGLVTTEPWAQ